MKNKNVPLKRLDEIVDIIRVGSLKTGYWENSKKWINKII